jgi:hypothetical protein
MLRKSFSISILCTAIILCFATVMMTPKAATEQSGMKTLTILDAWNEEKTSPVKITSVDFYGQKIVSDHPFAASDDWLRDLKFTVQNVSRKTLKQIVLRIEIPIDGNKYVHPIGAGKNYFYFAEPLDTNNEILLKPGQSMEIQFNTANPTNYRGFISRFQGRLPQIDKAQVYLTTAIFEDTKQGWMKGKFMQRISDTEWKALSIDR